MKFKVIVRTSLMIVLSATVVGLFSFKDASAGTPGNIQRVSINSSGGEQVGGITSSQVQISGNGRYVVFSSSSTNLVANDTNGVTDIFVRDTLNNTTSRVSVSTAGTEANNNSNGFAISYDGRYVVFSSSATNLVTSDTNSADDIFVRDLQNSTTTLVSVTSSGTQGNSYSTNPAVNADGRFVVFASLATNFTTGISSPNFAYQYYVKDMLTGTVRHMSKNTSGGPMSSASKHVSVPSISCDGGTVAFATGATDLVANDTNGQVDVFVQSLVGSDDYRVNVTSMGDDYSFTPTVSCNGNEVAFVARAANLVSGDTNVKDDAFVYHRLSGSIERVSVNSSGVQGNDDVYGTPLGISGNGRYVSFVSRSNNVPRTGYTYSGTGPNVFVRDLKTGTTQLVSVAYNFGSSAQSCLASSMGDDGSKVAFSSGWDYLVANDTGYTDIFTADTGF